MKYALLLGVFILATVLAGCTQPNYEVLSIQSHSDGTHVSINVLAADETTEQNVMISSLMDTISKYSSQSAPVLIIDAEYDSVPFARVVVPKDVYVRYTSGEITEDEFASSITIEKPAPLKKVFDNPNIFQYLSTYQMPIENNDTISVPLPKLEQNLEKIDADANPIGNEPLENSSMIELPSEEPKALCGDGTCSKEETCGSCTKDCACINGQVCYNNACIVPACMKNSDCNDKDGCTKDKCAFAGHALASCEHTKITECSNSDGCCLPKCDSSNDDDCGEGDVVSAGWVTGSVTLPASTYEGGHVFFDFSKGKTTTNFDDEGDIFINSFGEVMGECKGTSDYCVQIVKESSLGFNEMENMPLSSESEFSPVTKGDLYWVKTLEEKTAKIEITDIKESGGILSIAFKWGYKD